MVPPLPRTKLNHRYAKGISLITKYQDIYGLGVVLGDGILISDGVVLGDGILISDGVVLGDNIITATAWCSGTVSFSATAQYRQ